MTADYVPQVGDRVRMRGWGPERWLDVIAKNRGYFFGFAEDDEPSIWSAGHDWVKVIPPVVYPDRWANVYPDGIGSHWATRALADEKDHGDRIAVIHLAADGTLLLHPVERES
jgi:hypothetical protein